MGCISQTFTHMSSPVDSFGASRWSKAFHHLQALTNYFLLQQQNSLSLGIKVSGAVPTLFG